MRMMACIVFPILLQRGMTPYDVAQREQQAATAALLQGDPRVAAAIAAAKAPRADVGNAAR